MFFPSCIKSFVAMALILVAPACFADPIDEQQLIGRWKTRENIDLVFTKEYNFTMKSPDLPRGAAGKWILQPDGQIEMIITAELNTAMQQKPVPEQKLQKQRLSASGPDTIQATAPGELTDRWTRIKAP